MDNAPDTNLTPTKLAASVGISLPYASQILNGRRACPQGLAVRIYRATGIKLAPITEATDAEIEVLERFAGVAQ